MLSGLLLASLLPPTASAQAPARILHIGVLSSGDLGNRSSLDEALLSGLRERGYVEGRNLVIERRYSSAKVKANAAELAAMPLDAIVTTCTPSTRIMKEATSSIPIVMAAVSDPVRQGLIASLAKPGHNVTGTTSQAEDLLGKRLEQLAALLPKTTTVAVLMNVNNPVHALAWLRLEEAARVLELKLLKLELAKGADLAAAMEDAARARPAALFVLPDDPMIYNLRPRIIEAAARLRLPDFHWSSEFVDFGGLMSYGESLRESYRATASYMDAIWRGARPGEMPVAQPTRFELVINLKTARALGLQIPQAFVLRADRVID
jgi:putative ABC transport system substrate-binding protein